MKTLSQEDSSSARTNKQTNKTKGEKFEPKTIKRSLETKLQKKEVSSKKEIIRKSKKKRFSFFENSFLQFFMNR